MRTINDADNYEDDDIDADDYDDKETQ